MGYYCNECDEDISKKVYDYSMQHFDRALCRDCQEDEDGEEGTLIIHKGKKPTAYSLELGKQLAMRGWDVELEKWDGFKHIDIAIVECMVNIEVDGGHHNYSVKQALADLKRTFYSFKKGFLTLRIPNALVKNKEVLEETADFISEFLDENIEQLEEDFTS